MSLTLLVGVPGSGKSTFCKEVTSENENAYVVSSDAIRKELFGREEDQSDNRRVFDMLRLEASLAIGEGKDVYVDSTNIQRRNREFFMGSSLFDGVEKKAIIFDTPIEECVERDARRNRTVGREVIEKMGSTFLCNYEVLRRAIKKEGFETEMISEMEKGKEDAYER